MAHIIVQIQNCWCGTGQRFTAPYRFFHVQIYYISILKNISFVPCTIIFVVTTSEGSSIKLTRREKGINEPIKKAIKYNKINY